MKKLISAIAAVAICASAMAQDYNRVGISYNNDHYGFNKEMKSENYDGFSLNGVGIDYRHGFQLGAKPMFIETGASFNFNFGSKSFGKEEDEGYWMEPKINYTNINLLVPVNFVYRFNITEDFSIAPYAGINFKINMVTKYKEKFDTNIPSEYLEGYSLEGEWINVYSKDEEKGMGDKDATWNRFQMGWQIGVGFQYKPFYLGIQYGTDFIPAYSHKFEYEGMSFTPRVNVGSLRVSLAYCF